MLKFYFYFVGVFLRLKYAAGIEHCVASIGGCPPDWSQWRDECYIFTEELQWQNATEECKKKGGVFLVPQSQLETQYLVGMQRDFWINCNIVAIGGQWDCQEGTTIVAFGSVNPQYQPNGNGEHCAVVYTQMYGSWSGRYWKDMSCNEKHPAICKQSAKPLLHL